MKYMAHQVARYTKTGDGVESAQQGGLLIKELGQESVLEEVTLSDD